MVRRTHSAGGVILNFRDEILVVRQQNDSWSLPKGHLDPGETVLEAAYREIFEETGLVAEALTYLDAFEPYERFRIGKNGGEDRSELKIISFFLFRTHETALNPQDPDNPEARWMSPADTLQYLTHPKDRAFFQHFSELRWPKHL